MTKKIDGIRFAGALTEYWAESSRPLVSLVFIAPMLVAYEASLLLLGPHSFRNGADIWLRQFLDFLGLQQYFLLPCLTCGILLAWHHVKGERWQFGWIVLYGMFVESVVFGTGLLLLGHWQSALAVSQSNEWVLAISDESVAGTKLLAYLGAGIYEELLFRLMLLPLIAASLRIAGVSRAASLGAAVITGSLLFAMAHYRFDLAIGTFHFATAAGDPFSWITFTFRFLAGAIFSLLFVYRGFGVAAGAHALYDILLAA